jgi:hypothetical protein
MSQCNILSITVGIGDGQNVQHKSRLNVQGSHWHRDKMLQWTFWLGQNVTVDVVNLDISSRHNILPQHPLIFICILYITALGLSSTAHTMPKWRGGSGRGRAQKAWLIRQGEGERGCRNVIGQARGEAGPERYNRLGLAMATKWFTESRKDFTIKQFFNSEASSMALYDHIWLTFSDFSSFWT